MNVPSIPKILSVFFLKAPRTWKDTGGINVPAFEVHLTGMRIHEIHSLPADAPPLF